MQNKMNTKKEPRLLNDAKIFTDKIQERFQEGEFTYSEAKGICDSIPCMTIIISHAINSGVLKKIKRGVYQLQNLSNDRALLILNYARNSAFNRYIHLKKNGLLKINARKIYPKRSLSSRGRDN